MELRAIVSAICDQADDFLAGVTKRDEARAGIAEWLTMNHPKLAPADKKAVIDQTMRILDHEGFFEAEAGGPGEDAGDFTAAEE
ncbi:MAG: hypothetical protein HYV95_15855 [Opitutae bacterium]|nr:hypothetical protein [Opitutae bacterium]